jgi:NIF3 (NGG1p interacting factor 3)
VLINDDGHEEEEEEEPMEDGTNDDKAIRSESNCKSFDMSSLSSSCISFVQKITVIMNRIAPISLADVSWDNVGLLIESPHPYPSQRVLLTIDLTGEVVQESIEKDISVIISYHPPLFSPLKRLTLERPLSRYLLECIRRGISIYSPHTVDLLACTKKGLFNSNPLLFYRH